MPKYTQKQKDEAAARRAERYPFNCRNKENAKEFLAAWLKASKASSDDKLLVEELAAECAKVKIEREGKKGHLLLENNKGVKAYQGVLPKAKVLNAYRDDSKSGLIAIIADDALLNNVKGSVIKAFKDHAEANLKDLKDKEKPAKEVETLGVNEDWLKGLM